MARVEPMLARVSNWEAWLADIFRYDNENLIKQHSRTGRPPGNSEIVSELEVFTAQTLAPGRPGPKPGIDD